MAANNETGVVSDLDGIEAVIKETGTAAYWMVDCVQALGKLPLDLAATRAAAALAHGTTTMEVKTGYGLTVDDEARCLRLARTLTSETTFLGAHVVPAPDG